MLSVRQSKERRTSRRTGARAFRSSDGQCCDDRHVDDFQFGRFRAFECAESSRTGGIGALDGTPQYSTTRASGGVATVSGLTTSGPSELIFAACLAVDSTCSVGTGYTARNDANAYDVATGRFGTSFVGKTGQMIQDKVGVPAGAQSATFKTTKSTDNVILGLLAVK